MQKIWNTIKMYWQWAAGVAFFGLLFVGFALLKMGSHAAAMLDPVITPWQLLQHNGYIYVFAAITFVLGIVLVFSTFQSRVLLTLLVLYSLLFHSYLPLTHPLIYGADGWRHIASEAQLLDGHWPSKPVVRQQLHVPATSFELGDLAYSGFWILTVVVAKISTLDLLTINKWLVPIAWSIFFPILLYLIGRTLEWSKRRSLMAVWFASLPFALQAGGSFTLPVNLGCIVWLVGVVLTLKRLKDPQSKQLWWLALFGVLSIFNYTLFFVLFWLGWGIAEVVLRSKEQGTRNNVLIFLIFLSSVALPLLELIAGYSHFGPVNFFGQIKQLIGNFLGVYIVFGPRPHDIATGNIIFNQTPSYAFVENLFTIVRWWIIPFMLVFWSTVTYGWWQLLKKNVANRWMAVVGASLFVSYIISRYFLLGEEVLTRRLDVVLAFFAIIFFVAGISCVYQGVQQYAPTTHSLLLVLFVLIISVAIATSYSLGPDTQAVSPREYSAMQYVWSQEKDTTNHCVIADTYPLLALEAISKKAIVGGGFPIDKDFGQPERVHTYETFTGIKNIIADEKKALQDALQITGSNRCWLVSRWGYIVKMTPDFNFTSDWPAMAL